jgi:hypothetical protein
MRVGFVFTLGAFATIETLRNLNGCAHFPTDQRLLPRSDPRLLTLLLSLLVMIYFAFPGWD